MIDPWGIFPGDSKGHHGVPSESVTGDRPVSQIYKLQFNFQLYMTRMDHSTHDDGERSAGRYDGRRTINDHG